jgi:hypothetical protein
MMTDREISSALVRQHRFSLSTLLLIPLILSPLFLAYRESLRIVAHHWNGFGIEIFGLGFAYALSLTIITYRRRTKVGTLVTRRIFIWSLVRGVLFGILFFSFLLLPVGVTEQVVVYTAARPWTMRLFYFLGISFLVAVYGSAIGGAAGGILGLFLPRGKAIPQT